MSQDGVWTPALVERLKELHLEGKSNLQIATILGITRNTVCGKVHRLCKRGILPRKAPNRIIGPKRVKKETAKYGSEEHWQKVSQGVTRYHRSMGREAPVPRAPRITGPKTPTAPKPTNAPKGILDIRGYDECHGEVSGAGTMYVMYCAKPLTAAERDKGYRWCDYCRETMRLSYPYRRKADTRPVWKSDWVVAL